MKANRPSPEKQATEALEKWKRGLDPHLIELSDVVVFPHLINVQPTTARKARGTGILCGRSAPVFIKRGRNVKYRLSDVIEWLEGGRTFTSTADYEVSSQI